MAGCHLRAKSPKAGDDFFLALPTLGEARLAGAAASIKRLLFMRIQGREIILDMYVLRGDIDCLRKCPRQFFCTPRRGIIISA